MYSLTYALDSDIRHDGAETYAERPQRRARRPLHRHIRFMPTYRAIVRPVPLAAIRHPETCPCEGCLSMIYWSS